MLDVAKVLFSQLLEFVSVLTDSMLDLQHLSVVVANLPIAQPRKSSYLPQGLLEGLGTNLHHVHSYTKNADLGKRKKNGIF